MTSKLYAPSIEQAPSEAFVKYGTRLQVLDTGYTYKLGLSGWMKYELSFSKKLSRVGYGSLSPAVLIP